MIPQFSCESFDAKTLQACLRYVTDAFQSLATSPESPPQVLAQLGPALVEGIAERVRMLLSNVRSVHNTYAHINKIPPELLVTIFGCLVEPPAPSSRSSSTGLNKVHLPIASHVCRYWRQTANSMPELWNVIRMNRRRTIRRDETEYFLSMHLSHSGALPLSISLENPSPDVEPIIMAGVLANMSRVAELQLVDMSTKFLFSLGPEAPLLRALLLTNTRGYFDNGHISRALFHGWKTPHLSTISMTGCSLWSSATFGHLRHLIITSQCFQPQTAKALLHILSCNPTLESLILSEIWCNGGDHGELRQLRQRVEMRNLKRLFVRNSVRASSLNFVGLVNVNLDTSTTEDCAKYFSLSIRNQSTYRDISDAFPLHALGAPTRLTASSFKIVGTDGRLAFGVSHDCEKYFDGILGDCVDVAKVQELRLCFLKVASGRVSAAFRRMHQVNTLVVAGYVEYWLHYVLGSDLFPLLDDLWLSAPPSNTNESIIYFLEARKKAGKPIRTLRFVKNPDDQTYWSTLDAWKCDSHRFAAHVEQVLFEESGDRRAMELPPSCYTECELQDHWHPDLWALS